MNIWMFIYWTHILIQAQFAQMRPVTIAPSVAPRVPMYPPGGPGMGQQIFYGQGPPAIIPSQVNPPTLFLLGLYLVKSCKWSAILFVFMSLSNSVIFLLSDLETFCQPGFGYQQQLMPGMRPGGAPVPNFFVPMVQQGQQGQRPGGRRAGGVQQSQQPVPLMPQQVV